MGRTHDERAIARGTDFMPTGARFLCDKRSLLSGDLSNLSHGVAEDDVDNMEPMIISPDKFAAWFNAQVTGASRPMTAADIRLLTECGLIGRYGYYGRQDLETVRCVLMYEALREKRREKPEPRSTAEPPRCKGCGQPLSAESRIGRPKEYCPGCEPARARLRSRKWRARVKQKIKTEIGVMYN
jgi:hypothetical protein